MHSERFVEIENKYQVNKLKLTDFKKLMESLNPTSSLEVSSWDIYYLNETGDFIRFRKSDTDPELTVKEKRQEVSNRYRTEVNLILKKPTESAIKTFTELLGYKENFRIFKNCFIYYFNEVNIVYYSVMDEDMNEKGRFIEIEVENDKVSEDKAFEVLQQYEQKLAPLGLTAQHRLRKSLFESFRK